MSLSKMRAKGERGRLDAVIGIVIGSLMAIILSLNTILFIDSLGHGYGG